jgi:hypothetical protein
LRVDLNIFLNSKLRAGRGRKGKRKKEKGKNWREENI